MKRHSAVTFLRHKVWVLLHRTSNLMLKSADDVFAKVGMSHQQYVILNTMDWIGSPVTVSDVARQLDRNSNSISMIIDRMEKSGLVKRVRDLSDRRLVRLELTEEGHKKLKEGAKLGWELIEGLMSSLTEEELQVLAGLAEKLRKKAFTQVYPGKRADEFQVEDYDDVTRLLEKAKQRAT